MPQGRVTLWLPKNDRRVVLATTENQWLNFWGYIAAKTVGQGRREFRIQGMYIEFENVTNPGDQVTPPSFSPSDGVEYYNGLSSHATRDYLRVPLLQEPVIEIVPGYENDFDADAGEGNRAVFYAMTSGTTGVHGKSFSSSSNSTVIGAALVATPDWNDPTKDVLFARTYYATGNQPLKSATHQIGVTWELDFIQ